MADTLDALIASLRAAPDAETRRQVLLSAPPEAQQAFAALTPEELSARVTAAPAADLGAVMASPRTSGEAFSRVFPLVAPTAARVGGAIGATPGGVFGAAMSGGGEVVAQGIERLFGTRESFNPTQMAVQSGLGLIPGSAITGALRGAAMAGGGYAATEAAEGRPALTAGTGLAALAGAAGGGAAGRLAGRMAQGTSETLPTVPESVQALLRAQDAQRQRAFYTPAEFRLPPLKAPPTALAQAQARQGVLPMAEGVGQTGIQTAQDALGATIAGRAVSTPFPMAIAAPEAVQAAAGAAPLASRMAAVDAAVAAPAKVKPRASAGQVQRFTKLRELGVPEDTARKLSETLVTPLQIGGKPTKEALAPTRARLAKDLGREPDLATMDAFDALGIAYQEAKAAGAPQAEQRALGAMLSGAGRQLKAQTAAAAGKDALSRLRGQAGAVSVTPDDAAAIRSAVLTALRGNRQARESFTTLEEVRRAVSGYDRSAVDDVLRQLQAEGALELQTHPVPAQIRPEQQAAALDIPTDAEARQAFPDLPPSRQYHFVGLKPDWRDQRGAIQAVAVRELGQTAAGAAAGGLLGAHLGGEDDAEMGFVAGAVLGGLAATGRGREIIADSYAANLLGNLSSLLVRNPVSQALYGAYRNATRPLTAAADLTLSTLRGQPRSVFAGEVLPRMVALRQASTAGLSDMWEVLKSGKRPDYLFAETLTAKKALDVQEKELPGGFLTNFAPRIINALDAWDFKGKEVLARYGAAFSEAMRQKGRASWADIAARTANPSEGVRTVAFEEARNTTFKQKPGIAARTMLTLRDEAPLLRLFFTFIQTPESILRSGSQFTGAAPLVRAISGRQPSGATGIHSLFSGSKAEIAQLTAGKPAATAEALATRERVRGAEQLTDLTAGLAFGATMLALTDRDFLTGPMPRDEKERTMWEMEGRIPWALRLPVPQETLEAAGYDTTNYTGWAYVPMSGLLGPLALPAMYVAAVDDAWRRGEVDDKEAGQRLWEAIPKMLEGTLDTFWIGEMQAISKALDSQESWTDFVADKIANLLPGSATLKQVTTGLDPVSRKTRAPDDFRATIRNEIQSRIPGQSQELPAKVLGLGQPKQADVPDNWAGRLLIPRISLEKRDRALEALLHADYPIGLPEGKLSVGGVEVPQTPNEQAENAAIRGQAFRGLVERTAPGLMQAPPSVAALQLDALRGAASRVGSAQVQQRRLPQIRTALSDRQKARQEALGILNPPQP